jgi:hypothetical protein
MLTDPALYWRDVMNEYELSKYHRVFCVLAETPYVLFSKKLVTYFTIKNKRVNTRTVHNSCVILVWYYERV